MNELACIENRWIEELASTLHSITAIDFRIREHIEARQWDEGCRLSGWLVSFLTQKQLIGEDLSQKLIELGNGSSAQTIQIQRCKDMSVHFLSVLAKHLPIYRRMVIGLSHRQIAGAALSTQVEAGFRSER